jgi:hypothetical protein
MHPVFAQLTAATALRYRPAGRFAMNFVRGKLRYDPVYFALLTQGLLPAQGSLLDLGCGRGILMSLLSTARQWVSQHGWPEEWACRLRISDRTVLRSSQQGQLRHARP